MQDWRGREYDVGDHVAYVAISGRSPEIVEAEVLEFGTVKSGWSKGQPTLIVKPIRSSRFGRERHIEESRGWARDRVRLNVLKNVTLLEKK